MAKVIRMARRGEALIVRVEALDGSVTEFEFMWPGSLASARKCAREARLLVAQAERPKAEVEEQELSIVGV